MIEYSESEKETIRRYDSKKDLTITFLDDDSFGTIGGEKIYWESLTLTESLCDDDNLIFGACECAEMKIQVADVPLEIKNHEIRLDLTVDGIPVPLGIFFIANVEKATDKRYKILTCYDRMCYMDSDVIEWYNGFFPNVNATHTLKEFRDSFFNWIGIEQEETTLVNDNIVVRKTIDATELSGRQVIEAVCEINGAFGHINRNGVFEYKFLENTALYPRETLYPKNTLYPGGGELQKVTNAYYIPPSEQGDYIVRAINKLQIRQEEGDIGAIVTGERYTEEEENGYIINSNFLVYGNSAEELERIAWNLSTKIFGITYTPNSTNLVAMPYMEVGDGFYVSSAKTPFVSFILKRTLSGIQAMKDLWEAKGEEFQPEIVSGENQEVIQLRSRINVLKRNVDETSSKIERVEADLSGDITTLNSIISQTATELSAEVKRASEAEGKLSASIQVTAEGLSSKVEKNEVISSINQSPENIKISAKNLDLQGYVTFSGLENNGYVTKTDLSTSGKTTINGGNITTGKISASYIDGTNLKISGQNAIIQIGASGVQNNNYMYMVGYDGYTLSELHMDCKAVSCLGNDGYGYSINRKGLTFSYDNGVYFMVLRDENNGSVSIGSPSHNMNVLSPTLGVNSVNSFNGYNFANGGRIYNDGATDRINFADKNVHIYTNLSCAGNIELAGTLTLLDQNINGANISQCVVDYTDKNGVPYFRQKLTDVITTLMLFL